MTAPLPVPGPNDQKEEIHHNAIATTTTTTTTKTTTTTTTTTTKRQRLVHVLAVVAVYLGFWSVLSANGYYKGSTIVVVTETPKSNITTTITTTSNSTTIITATKASNLLQKKKKKKIWTPREYCPFQMEPWATCPYLCDPIDTLEQQEKLQKKYPLLPLLELFDHYNNNNNNMTTTTTTTTDKAKTTNNNNNQSKTTTQQQQQQRYHPLMDNNTILWKATDMDYEVLDALQGKRILVVGDSLAGQLADAIQAFGRSYHIQTVHMGMKLIPVTTFQLEQILVHDLQQLVVQEQQQLQKENTQQQKQQPSNNHHHTNLTSLLYHYFDAMVIFVGMHYHPFRHIQAEEDYHYISSAVSSSMSSIHNHNTTTKPTRIVAAETSREIVSEYCPASKNAILKEDLTWKNIGKDGNSRLVNGNRQRDCPDLQGALGWESGLMRLRNVLLGITTEPTEDEEEEESINIKNNNNHTNHNRTEVQKQLRALLPATIVWKDVAPQHYNMHSSGYFMGNFTNRQCAPIQEEKNNNNKQRNEIWNRVMTMRMGDHDDNDDDVDGDNDHPAINLVTTWDTDVDQWIYHINTGNASEVLVAGTRGTGSDCTHFCNPSPVTWNWASLVLRKIATAQGLV